MSRARHSMLILLVVGGVARADTFDLYWTDSGDGFDFSRVERASVSGDPRETIYFGGEVSPLGITLDDTRGHVYWSTSSGQEGNSIRRSNLDGTEMEILLEWGLFEGLAVGLDVDPTAEKLYWVDPNRDAVRRSNLDGTGVEDLVEIPGQSNLEDVALDLVHGTMYWTDRTAGRIQMANLDGSNVETILEGGLVTRPRGIAVDPAGGHFYFADSAQGGIARANLDGSDMVALLLADTPFGLDLDLDNGKIYFTETPFQGQKSISVANLDGSDFDRIILNNFDTPLHIAVIPEPFTLLLLAPAAMLILRRRSRR